MIFTLSLNQNKFAVQSCDKARFKESIFLTLNAKYHLDSHFPLREDRNIILSTEIKIVKAAKKVKAFVLCLRSQKVSPTVDIYVIQTVII